MYHLTVESALLRPRTVQVVGGDIVLSVLPQRRDNPSRAELRYSGGKRTNAFIDRGLALRMNVARADTRIRLIRGAIESSTPADATRFRFG